MQPKIDPNNPFIVVPKTHLKVIGPWKTIKELKHIDRGLPRDKKYL